MRLVRLLRWALPFALTLLLLQSALWSPQIPMALRFLVVAMVVLSASRPAAALLVLAGLVPFGYVLTTRVWMAHPFALLEALVLAFLVGYLWHRRRGALSEVASVDSIGLAARMFALIVLASCAVQLAVLQVWHDLPWPYAVSFFKFLFGEYLTTPQDMRFYVNGRAFVSTAALLLEGIALMLCTRNLCSSRPELRRQLVNVIVVSGTGIALLSFYEIPEFLLRGVGNNADRSLWGVATMRRGSAAIPSINGAGSYYVLVVFAAAAVAVASTRPLLIRILPVVIIVAALALTQTRSAIVAGIAIALADGVWLLSSRSRKFFPILTAMAAGAIAAATAYVIIVYNPLSILSGDRAASLDIRVQFAQSAMRMIKSSPIAGVGIGQYGMRNPHFVAPEFLEHYSRSDPHNYFLWIGAELGLIGLAVFLWLIIAALWRGSRALRLRQADAWFLGVFSGVIAFIVTWTIGQPLSIPQIAYTFWILVGVAAAHGGASAEPARHRIAPVLQFAAAAAVIAIVAGVPIRAQRAVAAIDLSDVRQGFEHASRVGTRQFQWAGPMIRVFLKSSQRSATFALAARHPSTPNGATVDISIDGQPAQRLTLTDKRFHDVRLDAPAGGGPFWRVDILIDPIGVDQTSELRLIAVDGL